MYLPNYNVSPTDAWATRGDFGQHQLVIPIKFLKKHVYSPDIQTTPPANDTCTITQPSTTAQAKCATSKDQKDDGNHSSQTES